jgi:hypothetical protein
MEKIRLQNANCNRKRISVGSAITLSKKCPNVLSQAESAVVKVKDRIPQCKTELVIELVADLLY